MNPVIVVSFLCHGESMRWGSCYQNEHMMKHCIKKTVNSVVLFSWIHIEVIIRKKLFKLSLDFLTLDSTFYTCVSSVFKKSFLAKTLKKKKTCLNNVDSFPLYYILIKCT